MFRPFRASTIASVCELSASTTNGSEPIRFDRIAARLQRDVGDSKEPIYLRADKDVRWKTVVAVLEKIKDAKYQNVQIVTRVFSPKK